MIGSRSAELIEAGGRSRRDRMDGSSRDPNAGRDKSPCGAGGVHGWQARYRMQPALGPSPSLSVTNLLPRQVLTQAGWFSSARSKTLPLARLPSSRLPVELLSTLIPTLLLPVIVLSPTRVP